MQLYISAISFYMLQILFVLFCVVNSICGQRYPVDDYYQQSSLFGGQQRKEHELQVKAALKKLEQAPGPQWVSNWPDSSIKLGQVSAVALDSAGNVLVFHRGPNVWDINTFSTKNVYQGIWEPPIAQPTVLVFNDTGDLIDQWGENLFYMPHGITVDGADNVWVTDVALHQVFKFTPKDRRTPALTLGEKFIPRDDDSHFCKPSAVAVLSSGDFFVADGYCNTRIIKFAPDGTRILQWGRPLTSSGRGDYQFAFNVPHALTLAEDRGQVCVADRERGRVACFRADNGTFVAVYHNWLIGPRLLSVAYAPVQGGQLYIVNGPTQTGEVPVRGYVVEFGSGRLVRTFGPPGGFSNPHDVVVTQDGAKVYVAELNPYKVYKFVDENLKNESRRESKNTTLHAKPTATVEGSGVRAMLSDGEPAPAAGWQGAAGGAAGAGGAALLVVAALALLKARNKGRKGLPRRRWEYGHGEFKLRRLLERRRFTRVHSEDSDEEPAPMLPPPPVA